MSGITNEFYNKDYVRPLFYGWDDRDLPELKLIHSDDKFM